MFAMACRLPSAALTAALLCSACAPEAEPAPDPVALEQFIARLEAQDRAARAAAIVEARREEEARIEASERRLERYRNSADRVLAAPTTAEGAVKALAGG